MVNVFLYVFFGKFLMNKPNSVQLVFAHSHWSIQMKMSERIATVEYCLAIKNHITARIYHYAGFFTAAVTFRIHKKKSRHTILLLPTLNAN